MTSTRTGVDVLDGDLEAVEGAGLGSKEGNGGGNRQSRSRRGAVAGRGEKAQHARRAGAHAGAMRLKCRGRTSGNWTSPMKRTPRFSRTIPSEAAKKARTWEMKCFSSSVRLSQCFVSSERSTSSAAG